MDNVDDYRQEDKSDDSGAHQGVEESDSSEDEVCCIIGFSANNFD